MSKIQKNCQIGLDFFEYLKESQRETTTNRILLKEIYNAEFRTKINGLKDPNFSCILYALKSKGKATIRNGNVSFNKKVKALYHDQWPVSRQPSMSVQDGCSHPSPAQTSISPAGAQTGVRARRNLASLLMSKLEADKAHFISDKHGVSITSDPEFKDGRVCFCVESIFKMSLYVENTGTKPVYFTHYTPLHWLRCFNLEDAKKVTPLSPLTLSPGDRYEIQVQFSTSLVGFYPATLAFEFKEDLTPSSTAFHIVRFIEAKYVTALGLELAPTAPYKPRYLCAMVSEASYRSVEGQPPESFSVMRMKTQVPLKQYEIPDYMTQLIYKLKNSSVFKDARLAILESPLNKQNYSERFHLQLFLEEIQMIVDIKKYNIPNSDREEHAPMFRDSVNKKLLVLEVPGVSENRPSVLRGDKLLVCPKGETEEKYWGYVHRVELEQVKLGFNQKLLSRFIDGMRFSVEFTVNRLTMRIQHRAVDLMHQHELEDVLFPAEATSSYQQPLPTLSLFDRQLEKNPEQYRAVQQIVAGSSKPAPYLVFGPPGTGKTVTMVEAIKQIEKSEASSHILACAPSNSAADLLCEKILEHVESRKVYRMYASSRDFRTVPENIKDCSNLVGDTFEFPSKEELMEYKIIVTTLLTAGRLVTGGIFPHYTHIFIDEAGHAVETECLIPLAGLLEAKTSQVVLAGDPKQLGPILRSPMAQKYGMGVSLLERLMKDFPLYQKNEGAFDSRFVTKLLRNYRSHPAILKVPNELFYDGELQVYANEMLRNSYCRWEHLPKKNFPVIFHGVMGVDQREASSPSYFNVEEVVVLMEYVQKLFETQGRKGIPKLSPSEIGIIAPYRKQVEKIRKGLGEVEKALKMTNLKRDLKVGSVEEFQGQERKVIMVSAVRSSRKYLELDRKFSLGFVKNEKRFNVAVTRAKALLIVVGNPNVLNSDTTWGNFIQYCKDEGGYTGFTDAEEMEDVMSRLSDLFIKFEAQVATEESVTQQQLDPEWRNDL